MTPILVAGTEMSLQVGPLFEGRSSFVISVWVKRALRSFLFMLLLLQYVQIWGLYVFPLAMTWRRKAATQETRVSAHYCLVASLFISHDVFLLLRMCPILISNWIFVSALVKHYRLNSFKRECRAVIPCSAIVVTAASLCTYVSKVAPFKCYALALTAAFLQLQYPDDFIQSWRYIHTWGKMS